MFGFSIKDEETQEEGERTVREEKRVLDAGQLPRLVNLRIDKARECACQRCGDLLDNLKTKTNLLEHNHKAEAPGLTFWNSSHKEGSPAHFETKLEKKISLTPKELTHHDEFIDSLLEVEHAWQRSQRNTCTNQDNDDFWMKHYQELKTVIAEQRKFATDSLDELRNEILQKEESEAEYID